MNPIQSTYHISLNKANAIIAVSESQSDALIELRAAIPLLLSHFRTTTCRSGKHRAYPAHNDPASTSPKCEYACDLDMSLLVLIPSFPSRLVDIIPCHHNVIAFTSIVTISNNDVALHVPAGLSGIP